MEIHNRQKIKEAHCTIALNLWPELNARRPRRRSTDIRFRASVASEIQEPRGGFQNARPTFGSPGLDRAVPVRKDRDPTRGYGPKQILPLPVPQRGRRGPHFAKRTSPIGQQTRGGVENELGRGEGLLKLTGANLSHKLKHAKDEPECRRRPREPLSGPF
jgi:hypothetical protein